MSYNCQFCQWLLDSNFISLAVLFAFYLFFIQKFQTTGSVELVSNVLARLSRKNYTFDELQQRPLPDGVNPLKLETYLEEDEFEVSWG